MPPTKIKYLLWKIGLRKNCPFCDSLTIEVGYPDGVFITYHKCSNPSCNFGKKEI